MGLGSFIGSVAGGALSLFGQHKANNHNAALANQMWQNNYAAQKEFVQNGIRWRVDDAKASGIHPLFALGASGSSFNPVNTQSYFENEYSGLGSTLQSMGQNIDRAKEAKITPAERAINELRQNELYDLEVRQKEANIALTQAEISATQARTQQRVPPLPAAFGDNGELISGQSQSSFYPNSMTQNMPVDVPSSYGSGAVQAGVQPMYTLYGSGEKVHVYPNKDLMDYISERRESSAYFATAILDDFYNNRISLPQPKSGYKWSFSPISLTFRQVPVNDKSYTVYEDMYSDFYK